MQRTCLIQGGLDSVQEKVFKEVERCRKVSFKEGIEDVSWRGFEVSTFSLEEERVFLTLMPV